MMNDDDALALIARWPPEGPPPSSFVPHADLRGARLRRRDLRGVDLPHARLDFADLAGADLSGARLTSTTMRFVNAVACNFAGADVRFADLSCANVAGADFHCATLRDAILANAVAAGCDLRACDLRGTQLRFCDMDAALLWGARLRAGDDDHAATMRFIEQAAWSLPWAFRRLTSPTRALVAAAGIAWGARRLDNVLQVALLSSDPRVQIVAATVACHCRERLRARALVVQALWRAAATSSQAAAHMVAACAILDDAFATTSSHFAGKSEDALQVVAAVRNGERPRTAIDAIDWMTRLRSAPPPPSPLSP